MLLLLSFCGIAYADELQPPDGYQLVLGETIVEPTMTLSYDPQQDMFRYTLPNDVPILATAPRGALTKSIALVLQDNTLCKLYYNDTLMPTYQSGTVFTQPGIYRFMLHQMPANKDLNTYTVSYVVRIQGDYENVMDIFTPATDFHFTELTRDGVSIPLPKSGGVWLEQDGVYRAEQENSDGSITYFNHFVLDRQAPYIFFSGDARRGYSSKPVTFMPSEPESTVTVLRGGSPYLGQSVIGDSGRYRITVTDPAGNSRRYDLTVDIYDFGLQIDPLFLVLIAIGVLVLAAVMLRARLQSRLI